MHDLWIFPTPRTSRSFARMDWYLNWQMCKGLAYAGLHLPEHVLRLADQNGVVVPPAPSEGPLLVIAGPRAPTKRCLVMDERTEALAEWLARAAAQAARLKTTSLRIFLPTGSTAEAAEAIWTGLKTNLTASFAVDPEVLA